MNIRMALVFLVVWGCLLVSITEAQPLRGDVNADGVIDGRDALLALRHVQGITILASEEQARADVFPLPGTGGRAIGDGKVTEDDALRILRYVVGLISREELQGEIAGPLITEFAPASGGPGTKVTLRGVNFVTGSTAENIVRLSGERCRTLKVTSTELTVEIPADAQSGHFTLITPGGTTTSRDWFIITTAVSGRLILPEHTRPQDFTVVSSYDEVSLDAQGNFTLNVGGEPFHLVAAIPKSGTDNGYMALYLPEMEGQMQGLRGRQAEGLTINAFSTAVSLLYIHPAVLPYDDFPPSELLNLISSLPETEALAQVIEQVFPTTPEPLDHPQVRQAMRVALEALFAKLPQEDVLSLSGQPRQELMMGAAGGSVWRLDMAATTVNLTHRKGQQVLTVGNQFVTPVDWLMRVAKVSTEHFPNGMEDIALAKARMVYKREKIIHTSLIAARGVANIASLAANFVQGLIDSAMVEVAAIPLRASALASPTVKLDPDEEAVYLVRNFSGAFRTSDPTEWNFIWESDLPNGIGDHTIAMLLNLMGGIMDYVGALIGGMDASVRKRIAYGVTAAVVKKAAQLGLVATSSAPSGSRAAIQSMLTVLWEFAGAVLGDALQVLKEELGPFFESPWWKKARMVFKRVAKVFNVVSRVVAFGRLVDRFTAMVGIHPLVKVTPLETTLVVVGNPFLPKITDFPSKTAPGWEFLIKGERFAPTAAKNSVSFGSQEATVLSVNSTGTELKVQVPSLAPGEVNFTVTARFEEATAGPVQVLRVPSITSMIPNEGFAAGTFLGQTYAGTEVTLYGAFFDPEKDQVFFGGDVQAQVDTAKSSGDRLIVRVPQGAQTGKVVVKTLDDIQSTSSQQFTIIGKPKLVLLEPSEAQGGATLVLEGDNFPADPAEVRVQFQFEGGPVLSYAEVKARGLLTADLPGAVPEGGQATVKVLTPAGVSEGKTVTRLKGLVRGSQIRVNTLNDSLAADKYLSLREAILLATTGSTGHSLTIEEKALIRPNSDVYNEEGQLVDIALLQPPGPDRADNIIDITFSDQPYQVKSALPPLSSGYDTISFLAPKVDASGVSGTLLKVSSKGNTVYLNLTKFGGSLGCEIVGGNGNTIDIDAPVRIFNSSSNYVVVNSSGGEHALEIAGDSKGNYGRVTAKSPKKTGVWLHGAKVEGNRVYAAVTGSGSYGFLLEDGTAGNYLTTIDENIQGCTSHGILIRGGASGNELSGVLSTGNGGDGLRIEGRGTDENKVGGILSSNAGNGITIAGGACYTEIRASDIDANNGHGILLLGGGTDHTKILGPGVSASYGRGNGKSGIAILADDTGVPLNTLIQAYQESETEAYPTEIYRNGEAGILIRGPAKGTEVHSAVLNGNGQGIVLEGAEGVTLHNNTIISRQEGVRLASQTTKVIIESGVITSTESIGLLLDEVSHIKIRGVKVTKCAKTGVVLRKSSVCEITTTSNGGEGRVEANKEDGIRLEAGSAGTVIDRQYVAGNLGNGIVVTGDGTTDTQIRSCRIWLNMGDGVRVEAGAILTTIGGKSTARNYISGNKGWGVRVAGVKAPVQQAGAPPNVLIAANYIGLLGSNVQGGVLVEAGAQKVTVGGIAAHGANVNFIAGNGGPGIQIQGKQTSDTMIAGNVVGLDMNMKPKANNGPGVWAQDGVRRLSIGMGPQRGNIISANKGAGIHLSNLANPVVDGNLIGTDNTGTARLGNENEGVLLENVQQAVVRQNRVVDNRWGIVLVGASSVQNLIQRNSVGLGTDGRSLGQREVGIEVRDGARQNRMIDNVVAYSARFGIALGAGTNGNTVVAGSIYGNGAGGISADKPEAPKVTVVRTDGILGEVPDSVTSGSIIQVYVDKGNQGRRFLGQTRVRGKAWRLKVSVPNDLNVTATVTDPQGNTSAFGQLAPPVKPRALFGEQLLVFTSTRDDNPEIYARAPGETVDTNLSQNPAPDHSPALSMDGTAIAFVSERNGNPEIWVMDTWGLAASPLTSHPAPDYDPAWSPDGKKIVFVSERDGNPEIYVMNVDGNGLQRLTNHTSTDRYPAWSPDGEKIVFTSNRGGNADLWVMGADGSNPTRLTDHTAPDYDPVWSPDGKRIALVSERDGNPEIYVMNADGSNLTRLTSDEASDHQPTWSPDGKWVAFVSERLGDAEIFAREVVGARLQRLTVSLGLNLWPSWGREVTSVGNQGGE
jgi:hypothetical protein